MAFLEIKDFNKTFSDGFKVLRDINFTLEKGEVLSIIGSSGSGKTTLLRCINGLERADEGKIFLNDETIFDASMKLKGGKENPRRCFGLVFQSFNLFPQYTAKENIRLPLALSEKEKKKRGEDSLSAEETDKVVEKLLDKVGLLSKAGNYPCELSGGQQQRVAIARAMALKPEVLCFDEPTSALDPELTGEVLKVIEELKRTENITMIIVTHEMEFARKVSDKVLFMADGAIEESGTPQEVFLSPKSELAQNFLKNYTENNITEK